MKKYDKILYISDLPEMLDLSDLISEVKYDGSNGRLTIENDKLIFGTRNPENEDITYFSPPYDGYFKIINDRINNLNLNDKIELFDLLEKYIIFFEMIGDDNLHKLEYDCKKDFIVFDGWDKKEEKYIPWDHVELNKIRELLELNAARRLEFKTYNQAKEWLYKQNSKEIEGIVLKHYALGLRVKILHPENSEVESAIFPKSKAKSQMVNYYESLFIHSYVTENRIDKIMFNLKVNSMKDISEILKELWRDLIIECLAHFIIKHNIDDLSIKYIKKNFPKIAVRIIKKIIQSGKYLK